ncbi:unnamed protein product [Haemonchus placei]|uniref:Ubiquitin-like domain-containing protein n=1 Tax=Haemonchus placei TaxID=6290 RepID=A0A0N4X520_HAEPC|nr:unnamed protein product [Haemonchus placei]
MMAYGSGNKAADLLPLAAHDDMSQGFINLEKWNNGTFFTTTAPSTTTTVAMSTSKAPTTKAPTTKASSAPPSPTKAPSPTVATAQPAPGDEMLAVNTPITSDDIDSLFSLIATQFGCGSYSDDADRPMVPNVVFIVSDNLASYTNVWKEFQTDGKMGWDCSDCPANPSYVFLSATADVAPKEIGVTYTLTDSDFGLDSSMKAMNLFNSIVNGLCNTQLRGVPFPGRMRLQVQIGIECIVIPCQEDESVHTVALRTVAKMRRLRPSMVKPPGGKEYEEIRRTVGNSLIDPEDRVGDVLKDGDFVILVIHRDETEEEKERRRQVELEGTRVALEKLDKPRKIKFDFDLSPGVAFVDKPTKLLVLDGASLTPADLVLCEKGECVIQVRDILQLN